MMIDVITNRLAGDLVNSQMMEVMAVLCEEDSSLDRQHQNRLLQLKVLVFQELVPDNRDSLDLSGMVLLCYSYVGVDCYRQHSGACCNCHHPDDILTACRATYSSHGLLSVQGLLIYAALLLQFMIHQILGRLPGQLLCYS